VTFVANHSGCPLPNAKHQVLLEEGEFATAQNHCRGLVFDKSVKGKAYYRGLPEGRLVFSPLMGAYFRWAFIWC